MSHRTQGHGEVELKFELDAAAAEMVRRHNPLRDADHHTDPQTSTYFDTDKCDVHRAGYSLRVRQVGKSFTQTVKTNGGSAGLFDRGEWEARVRQMAPEQKALSLTPLGRLKKLDRKAKPVARCEIERTTWLIDRDGSKVEVVLDSGTISAGDQEGSISELELELKDGTSAALFDFAQELGQVAALQVGVISKEERGRMLAQGAFGRENKASAVDIAKDMDVAQAFALIVHECIRHFRLNEALIVEQRDPGALHQVRVAMRRLRTAFSLFEPAIRPGSLEPLRKGLSEFVGPFSDARNFDVFLDKHGDELDDEDRRKITSAHSEAYDRVIDTLKAQRSRDMFLNLVEWTGSENWDQDAASGSIGKFGGERLDKVWSKVKRRGRGLGNLDEQHLHRLRISIKKLRYAVDFLSPLYPKKRVRKFASSLEEMQDCLGSLHDDMICRQIATDFSLGETGRTDVTSRSRQLKTISKRFKQLKRAGRFWTS